VGGECGGAGVCVRERDYDVIMIYLYGRAGQCKHGHQDEDNHKKKECDE
jgi:hypothetical protein